MKLNDVCKNFFGFAEVADSENQKKDGEEERNGETGGINVIVAAKYGPAESVNDADERIEAVKEEGGIAEFVPDKAAAVGDGRNVHSELNEEWDDETDVAVFDIERGDDQTWPKGGDECEQEEGRKREQSPSRCEAVKHHHSRKDSQGDETIDTGHHDRARRDYQTGKINLRDEVGVSDEALAGRGERV